MPEILIKKGTTIVNNYYKPDEVEVVGHSINHVIVHITQFSEIDKYIEHRLAGWMERAIEICGCRHVAINITKSLTKNNPYTEYYISWK